MRNGKKFVGWHGFALYPVGPFGSSDRMSDMIQTIDWEQLDMIADGYPPDFVEIYRVFELDFPSILVKLDSALAAGDAVAASRAAHQAKGSAANFGFIEFSSGMAQIEQSAKLGALAGLAEAAKHGRQVFEQSMALVKRERGV